MTITFKWNIDSLECFPEHNGNFMAIHKVYWTCTAYFGAKREKISGIIQLPDSSDKFIEYKDLTEQLILHWCFKLSEDSESTYAKIDKSDIEYRLAKYIEQKQYPLSIMATLPWQK